MKTLRYLLHIVPLFFVFQTRAQIAVSDTMALNDLIQSLVGDGITISNITTNGGSYGEFSNGDGSIGISDGLIMTSGDIQTALGPNNIGSATSFAGTPGDADLEAQIGSTTFDATVIEFDLTPNADIISFNYVFASEEYPEFVCSSFNDAFAFFVSGPGIAGMKNIALLPGTGVPVTINNVNSGNPNDPGCIPQNFKKFVANYSSGGGANFDPDIQYDGYTVPLTAEIAVTPCQTYHFKLVIADVGDSNYDSGVFIERGSIKSFKAQIVPVSFYDRWIYGIEGCNDGGFVFTRDYAMSDTIVLKFLITGSAENGVDYTEIVDSVVVPAFEDTVIIDIHPVADTVDDPFETVVIYLIDQCTGLPDYSDSAVFEIREKFVHDVPDEKVCIGNAVQLNTSYDLNVDIFTWSPSDFLTCTDCVMPFSSPDSTFQYYVEMVDTLAGCEGYDTMTVEVYEYPESDMELISDTLNTICLGDTHQLNVTGTVNIGSVSYEWVPDSELIPITDSSASIFPDTSKYFYALIFNEIGCSTLDSHYVNVSRQAYFEMTDPPILCYGDSAWIGPDVLPIGDYIYSWTGTGSILYPDSSYTFVTPPVEGTHVYTLLAESGIDFCSYSNTVNVTMDPLLEAGFIFSCEDVIAPLPIDFENTTIAGHEYQWSFMTSDSTVLGNSTDQHAHYTFDDIGDFIIKLHVVGADSSCQDSAFSTVNTSNFEIYNIFTPNGDGVNDVFYIKGIKPGFTYLEVYNRWGERVYFSDGYNNDWDGSGVSEGVYYYYFWNPNRDKKVKGWVTIMR